MRPPPGQLYDDGSGQRPFYEPAENERLTLPPPPEPPPPPDMKLTLSGYAQTHFFVSDVEGSLGEVGAKIGQKEFALKVGYLPEPGVLSFGMQLARYYGVQLADLNADTRLSFLGPAVTVGLVSDFSDDVFGVLEVNGPGLGVASCGKVPFFAQARIPNVGLWLPFETAGADIDAARASVQIAWGFSAEAGILFY